MKIKGEYTYTILIQNMFHTYIFRTNHHNLVTDDGLELALKCMTGTNNGVTFGDVHVGTGTLEPQLTDTLEQFTDKEALNEANECEVEIVPEKNKITYNITGDGEKINSTTEIGVWSTDEKTLVSHDRHDQWNVPSGSLVSLQYTFTMTNYYD